MTSPTIPEQCLAAVLHQHGGTTSIEDVAVPAPSSLTANQCLIRILYSGLCHSDLSNSNNIYGLPSPLPAIFGHEGAGLVVALGAGYQGDLAVGDRVGVKYIQDACLGCEMCLRGYESSCVLGPQMSGVHVDGTFRQYMVSSARYVTRIPVELDMAEAAPVLCAGVTCLRGLKEAKLSIGDWVAIPGAGGGLGHLAVQYALALGHRVVGIDTGADKRALVEGYGAKFIDFKESSDIVAAIREVSGGRGVHAALVSAASEGAYAQATAYLRDRGTLVVMGLPAEAQIHLPILQTALKGLKVVGCFVGNRQDANEALALHAMGRAKLRYEVVALDQINDAYARLKSGSVLGRIVLNLAARSESF